MRLLPLTTLLAAGLIGCNPYENLKGDFYIGPIDATGWPDAYLGAGFDPTGAVGTIGPSLAAVDGGEVVAYYPFPVSADVANPLRLRSENTTATRERALLYVFDGDPVIDTVRCVAPPDYVYDARRDFVRFDRQGNIFQQRQVTRDSAVTPDQPGYVPIYAEVPVTSAGEDCNQIHSATGLITGGQAQLATVPPPPNVMRDPVGIPDGKYLASAVVDPRAIVLLPDGTLDFNGMGPQRFGWVDHFLVAYLEGGYVPTVMRTLPATMTTPETQVVDAVPATLLAPNTFPDADGNPVQCDLFAPTDPAAPCIGQGFDLLVGVNDLNAARGQAGYSPLCRVLTYTPDAAGPATDPAQVDPTTIDADTGTFVYCLQLAL